MQNIEPSFQWESIYVAARDKKSPFFGRHYSETTYENDIYGYYIHPLWDDIGSETLFCKILYTDYTAKYTIIELFGEWNDTLHNDVMHLKRTVVDHFVDSGIKHFILVGENVLNFHGSLRMIIMRNGLKMWRMAGLRRCILRLLLRKNGPNTRLITT
jgi:hypothetical protein